MKSGRTLTAALVTAVALGLPCVAWFVAGSRAAGQEARRIEREPIDDARAEAERIARRLAVRLESLRHSETRRSYFDYQSHEHGYDSECTCEPRRVSPLARGPADPLIWTHFQIDEVGQLTLPTLVPDGGEDNEAARQALSDERAVLEVLECAASDRLASLPSGGDAQTTEVASAEWIVTVGPFQWHRVSLAGQPALVALREVTTPAARLTQGLVIRREELHRLLQDSRYSAALRPGEPAGRSDARIPIEGAAWTVTLDRGDALAAAAGVAAKVRSRFRTVFTVGLLAALLAGGLVVGLVWQAERLARQRARFAASAAHELRTPLAGLRLYGEMLAEQSGDPDRRRDYARRIAAESERLGRVVTNLLGFSKLERGELRLQARADDLGAAVRESLERLRPALEAGGARIEESIADPLRPVWFDREALHQILQNLLDNADRFSRSATDRTIRVEVGATREGSRMSVIDHGPGVDPSLKRNLFEAFVRHPSPDAPDGLGLGLALVRALARAQEATVAHDDVDGGGSKFTVHFRAAA